MKRAPLWKIFIMKVGRLNYRLYCKGFGKILYKLNILFSLA
jgi:hypothetical protein